MRKRRNITRENANDELVKETERNIISILFFLSLSLFYLYEEEEDVIQMNTPLMCWYRIAWWVQFFFFFFLSIERNGNVFIYIYLIVLTVNRCDTLNERAKKRTRKKKKINNWKKSLMWRKKNDRRRAKVQLIFFLVVVVFFFFLFDWLIDWEKHFIEE